MLLDHTGTEYRGGRVVLSKDWLFRRERGAVWWEPDTEDRKHFVIRALVRLPIAGELSHEIAVWQGNFFDLAKALKFWRALQDGTLTPRQWDAPTPSWFPGLNVPGIVYQFATIDTYMSTGTTTWSPKVGVSAIDYLAVAGGGGGGTGGGGGGQVKTDTNFATSAPATVTVGAGGTTFGGTGGSSVFSTITALGGGYGGAGSAGAGQSGTGGGGGGSFNSGNGGTGSGGGNGGTGNANTGGGGGGGGASGTNGTNGAGAGTNFGGNGGNGTASSISGSSVTYAGGGGGGTVPGGGSGGTGGGGAGGNVGGTAGSANTGGGGGGVISSGPGAGGSGIVIVSYTLMATILVKSTNQSIKRAAYW